MTIARAVGWMSLALLVALPVTRLDAGTLQPATGGSRLLIQEVRPDLALGILHIRGHNFRQRPHDRLFVTLAGEPLALLNLSDTEILVELPPAVAPGTYRLVVLSRRGLERLGDAIDITLGGPGPLIETDPQVGSLTAGGWCASDGAVVNCNQAPPVLVESDPRVRNVNASAWCAGNAAGSIDCDRPAPVPAAQSCPQGSVTGADASGALTCRPRVGFLARRATSFTPPNGAITNIPFDQEIYDYGNDFNADTGVFTAPVAGFYAFSAAVMVQGVDVGDLYYMHLSAGGLNHGASGNRATNHDWNTASASAIVYLNVGETAFLRAYISSSGSGSLYGNPVSTFLWTYLQGGLVE
jgi:hypothetical protein